MKIVTATSCFKSHSTTSLSIKSEKPTIEYLTFLYYELQKAFNPYSNYFIMYYIYMQEGVKSNFNLSELIKVFFKDESSSGKENCKTCENLNLNKEQGISNFTSTSYLPERPDFYEAINQALDVNYLPTFDEKTGDFLWNQKQEKMKSTEKENKSFYMEPNYGKSLDIKNGSLISLNSSVVYNNHHQSGNFNNFVNTTNSEMEYKTPQNTKKMMSKDISSVNNNKKKLVDDLNSLLKKMEIFNN